MRKILDNGVYRSSKLSAARAINAITFDALIGAAEILAFIDSSFFSPRVPLYAELYGGFTCIVLSLRSAAIPQFFPFTCEPLPQALHGRGRGILPSPLFDQRGPCAHDCDAIAEHNASRDCGSQMTSSYRAPNAQQLIAHH